MCVHVSPMTIKQSDITEIEEEIIKLLDLFYSGNITI